MTAGDQRRDQLLGARGTAGGIDGRRDTRVLPLRKGEDVALWTRVR